jgi:peptidoglycan/LPS O-acetylase OafA/YrhL
VTGEESVEGPEGTERTIDHNFAEYTSKFRPDIQALRALAVVLVVLFHADFPGIHGGFLGVDVFFVISGFVITGVLLQERARKQSTSITDFYARRIRRILPLATVVLIATVFAVYHWLSFVSGAQNANDAKWVAAFLANFHFASQGTQYFTSQLPPSAFQQYWSLAVEEQFYLIWPLMFLGLVSLLPKIGYRAKLMTALAVVIIASVTWSIIETGHSESWAFFSPLTRAWELALGALLAVATPMLRNRAPRIGLSLCVVGLVAILFSTWFFNSSTSWPGSAVIIPVLATGAIIAGGTLREASKTGRIVGSVPIQWTGNISYSLYLVHWPILIIASEYALKPLPLRSEIELVVLSFAVAAATFYLIEKPFRKANLLVEHRSLTFGFGVALTGLSYAAIYWHLHHF